MINPCETCLVSAACMTEYSKIVKKLQDYFYAAEKCKVFTVPPYKNIVIELSRTKKTLVITNIECKWAFRFNPRFKKVMKQPIKFNHHFLHDQL